MKSFKKTMKNYTCEIINIIILQLLEGMIESRSSKNVL